MEQYDTLSSAITALRQQGYTADFNTANYFTQDGNDNQTLQPDQFHIDKFFRFEDNTDPDDQAILYAISATDYGLKGVLVNGYGIYSDVVSDETMKLIKTRVA